jgi:hypothetical protein
VVNPHERHLCSKLFRRPKSESRCFPPRVERLWDMKDDEKDVVAGGV